MRGPLVLILVWSMLVVIGCGAAVPPTLEKPALSTPSQTASVLPTVENTTTPTTAAATPIPMPSDTPTASPTLTPSAARTGTPTPTSVKKPAAGEAQLKMVLIRAKSPLEVEQLRRMQLDIVRITPVESNQTPTSKKDFLNRQFIIEVVVPSGILAKLTAMGFEVTEVP